MTNTILIGESFGLDANLTMSGEGPAARRRRVKERARSDARYRKALSEAKALLNAAWAGDRIASIRVNEAITTSDLFKSAAGEVLDVELLAAYAEVPTQWTKFAARTTVRNFKPKQLRELVGSTATLARVPEHTNYPEAKHSLEERSIQVNKFGEQFGYTFEARVNDEIGELQSVPGGWATKARYTEDDVAIESLANPVTGAPNTAFFNVGNGNLGTGTLTAENLQAAITVVTTKKDENGRLRTPGPLQLVVGPALQFTAERIMNTTEIRTVDGDGNTVITSNPFRGKVTLTVLANLPGTAWFVVPTPQAPRPAFYVAFLAGFETPDLRYKADQGRRVGGGEVSVDDGSFDDDTIYYRCRHIVGGASGDPLFTYASDGVVVP